MFRCRVLIFVVLVEKMCSFTASFFTKKSSLNRLIMTFVNIYIRNKTLLIGFLIVFGLTIGSCTRARYRKMIKKRRTGHQKRKTHRSKYSKKLRKSTISTSSKYYIKNQRRNYRRRPWYDH